MPVTYTITSGDVASVSGASRLTEGVTFDWSNQKIYVPSSVQQVTAQWVVDNCRFAESLSKGLSRPQIIVGAGKVQIGTDPDTLSPISTPTIAIFLDEWRIVTQKTSGVFVVRDIYMNLDASSPIPYENVTGVFIQYLTSVTGAVATVESGGGGGLTAAQVWQYSGGRSLSDSGNQAIAAETVIELMASQLGVRIEDIHEFLGLKEGSPMTATTTQHTVGGKRILVQVDENTQTTTLTRSDP